MGNDAVANGEFHYVYEELNICVVVGTHDALCLPRDPTVVVRARMPSFAMTVLSASGSGSQRSDRPALQAWFCLPVDQPSPFATEISQLAIGDLFPIGGFQRLAKQLAADADVSKIDADVEYLHGPAATVLESLKSLSYSDMFPCVQNAVSQISIIRGRFCDSS